MDDFIYSEPRSAEFHSGDFDGDGGGDTTVFRLSTGNWIILQSGSMTVLTDQFGAAGDIPLNGDFDGDSLADKAIYRPSVGQWWFRRSDNGRSFAATFGSSGDKPAVADYDKDGRSDIAIVRPSSNEWFVLRSGDNFASFYSYPFGTNGAFQSLEQFRLKGARMPATFSGQQMRLTIWEAKFGKWDENYPFTTKIQKNQRFVPGKSSRFPISRL